MNLAVTSCGWNTCSNTRGLLLIKYFIFHLVLYLWKKINILAVLRVVFLAKENVLERYKWRWKWVEHVGFQMQMMRLGQCEMDYKLWIQWQGVTLLVICLRICLICFSQQEGKGIQILSALFGFNQLHFETSTSYPRLWSKEGCECLKSRHDGFVSCLYKLVKGKNVA